MALIIIAVIFIAVGILTSILFWLDSMGYITLSVNSLYKEYLGALGSFGVLLGFISLIKALEIDFSFINTAWTEIWNSQFR